MHVLLAEDDPVLGRALQVGLVNEGLSVDWTRYGLDAVAICGRGVHAALVLDLGLPDMGGFEILHRIRQLNWDIPIIVVTARGSIHDRISGLDLGADDYLTKPFELLELVARLRAVERRARRERAALISAGPVAMDVSRRTVTRNQLPIPLSVLEFELLRMFLSAAGELSLAKALQLLTRLDDDIRREDLVACMSTLRTKLEMDFEHGETGWRLRSPRTLH